MPTNIPSSGQGLHSRNSTITVFCSFARQVAPKVGLQKIMEIKIRHRKKI